jgi:Nuclease-related domain
VAPVGLTRPEQDLYGTRNLTVGLAAGPFGRSCCTKSCTTTLDECEAGALPCRRVTSFASTLKAGLPTLCTKVLFEPSLPGTFADMGESRVMKLRFPGTCATCGAALDRGERAYWDAQGRVVYCHAHFPSGYEGGPGSRTNIASTGGASVREPPVEASALERGVAGGSAQREHDRRHAARVHRVREQHPVVCGALLAVFGDPQTTRAWGNGAEGERAVARRLDALADRGVIALYDRSVPGSSANIDHIAVGPSGIYVIDAKYRGAGRVQLRRPGSIFSPAPPQLWAGQRNCTRLVAGMAKQVDIVKVALPEGLRPQVLAILALVNVDWGFFPTGFEIDGALVAWPKEVARVVGRAGPLPAQEIRNFAGQLAHRLKPA